MKALYLVRAENGLTKIGIADSPKKRLSLLRSNSPLPLELIHMAALADAADVEAALHVEFASRHSHGEWFRLTEADVASICSRYPATDISFSGDKTVVLLGLKPDDHATIREAARQSHMPITQFIVHHGLLAADRINP